MSVSITDEHLVPWGWGIPFMHVYGKPNKDAIRKDVLYDWHERREYR